MTETAAAGTPGLAPKWKVLISVVFGTFMVVLDSTVVNVAFPTLRADFGTTLGATQWVISVYVLALGVATPLSGFLGDRFGMRRVYVAGLGVFATGSLLCALAPSLPLLVAARSLQGIGGGVALPLGTAHLFRTFPPGEQGKALGLFGVVLLTAPALGPLLGGMLVSAGNWRWIFLINVPIGVVGVALGSRWLVNYTSDAATRLSWASVAASTVGFGALLYAASTAAEAGWTSATTLTWLGVGLAGLAAFTVVTMRATDPLLDLRLYRKPVFLNATLVGYVATVALFGAEFLLPVYLQSLRGISPAETGVILLPLAITAAVVTPLAGFLYDRVGPRPLVVLGYGILVLNTWELAHLTATTPLRDLEWLLVLRGAALGLTVQTTLTTALGVVAPEKVSRASSLVNSTRSTIQAIGVAVLATVLASTISPQTRALQADEGAPGSGAGLCQASEVTARTAAAVPGPIAHPVAPDVSRRACDESLAGFDRAYTLTFWAAIAATVLGAFLPGWPGSWLGRGQLERGGDPPPPAA